ncbi:MAG: hypothetical protein EAZ92_15905 [Candidatus Kapaibacterium sp.]|nr:MAG: hypothetical protein EAZ92_15905 [Candidatus Kapabacteria bacterium]
MPLQAYTSRSTFHNTAQKALGMVVIRVQHRGKNTQLDGFHYTATTPTNDRWSISMNNIASQRSLAQAMQRTDEAIHVMELWNELLSEADKHTFSQELHNAMKKRSTLVGSSVVTHNFALVTANGAYQGFCWVCSFLSDTAGNVSRITASLCALPQAPRSA